QIETRWAAGDSAKVQAFANELVSSNPNVILANATTVARALQAHTSDIPVVFVLVSDPVGDRLVTSLGQYHRVHDLRILTCQQVVGDTQGECAARQPCCHALRPSGEIAGARDLPRQQTNEQAALVDLFADQDTHVRQVTSARGGSQWPAASNAIRAHCRRAAAAYTAAPRIRSPATRWWAGGRASSARRWISASPRRWHARC